ncbi:hypothetical protein HD806DRAFT_534039 [Xylariaceae sp. AK1471]|nr:hypothetical protein HD806DRAFT_534039 [Xylariaceae sp. AK1471]
MSLSKPKVIGVGTTCYVTTTDNRTVLKGYQVWFDGNLVYDYGVRCEERLAREATIYKHFGKHPQILTCFGLEEMALDIATGLSYVHLRGAMSCDLSCTNLFLFDELRVKLGDFSGALLDGFDFEWDQTHESRYHLPSRGREYNDVPLMKRELFGLGSAIYEIVGLKHMQLRKKSQMI